MSGLEKKENDMANAYKKIKEAEQKIKELELELANLTTYGKKAREIERLIELERNGIRAYKRRIRNSM